MDKWAQLEKDLAEGYLSKDESKLLNELKEEYNNLKAVADIPAPQIEKITTSDRLRRVLKDAGPTDKDR